MIAAILRKVRARAKQKGLAMRTARGFLRQVFVSRVRERVYEYPIVSEALRRGQLEPESGQL
jgi:hypothetical protein